MHLYRDITKIKAASKPGNITQFIALEELIHTQLIT